MSTIDIPPFPRFFQSLPPQTASIHWDYYWSSEIQNALGTVKAKAAERRHFSEDNMLRACWWTWFRARILLCEMLENLHAFSKSLDSITGWVSHRHYTTETPNINPCYGIILDVPANNLPLYTLHEMIGMFFADYPEMLPLLPPRAQFHFGVEQLHDKVMAITDSLHAAIDLPHTLRNMQYKYFIWIENDHLRS
jgi:hypothetical protein